ncbi:hypothetical protein VTK73DRAFT_5931 [Phialemonium thermophilum]|uniref:Xylanolytic transcriptional activator regulatory domain-containing protein n=1 Tax=Phialemonium thermophilum TaxID=223376 RepID=A0ABR3V1V2_9PEZI
MEGPEVVLPGPQPLPRQTRASMALYVEVYWSRFHPLYPVVHRATFGSSAEEVLRCAMAAVGTQYLDDAEHRRRGNQLHEYAWQEIKRILQWDIQVMQAILLCELFARFRGRKAATKPSKPFASLCSRVGGSVLAPRLVGSAPEPRRVGRESGTMASGVSFDA